MSRSDGGSRGGGEQERVEDGVEGGVCTFISISSSGGEMGEVYFRGGGRCVDAESIPGGEVALMSSLRIRFFNFRGGIWSVNDPRLPCSCNAGALI